MQPAAVDDEASDRALGVLDREDDLAAVVTNDTAIPIWPPPSA